MFESKYSKVLTGILIIVIIAILGLLGFLGYEYYQNYIVTKDTSDFVDNFQGDVTSDDNGENNEEQGNVDSDALDKIKDTQTSADNANKKPMYQGFGVLGTMEIPATNFKYPVLEKTTKRSIEVAVAYIYGTDLNEPGNTVIIGHNYRNGLFFSNNKKLQNGDKIFITDTTGRKVTYTIYNKFETTPEDTTFYQRDTDGKSEITLSTCTDDSRARLIIFARED